MIEVLDRHIQIPASDGFLLAATVLEPSKDPSIPMVIINSATAVKRGYYLRFAQFLAQEGFRVVTFDYRGVGGSRPPSLKGFEAKMQHWAEKDTEGVFRWHEENFPSSPLFLVGHSFGGQAMALTPSRHRLRGALTVAAQSGYWRHWPAVSVPKVLFFWYVLIPITCRLWGYFPAKRLGISEDLPAGVALQWARWGRHPDYIRRDEVEAWQEGFEDFDRPILAYSFSDDFFAPPRAASSIQACYSGATMTSRPRRPEDYGVAAIGHWGFFREKFRDSLWTESLTWLRSLA
ncbi:MAG: alpha/beta fold hydrolase [Deltaproteobacteria bacterium]|nr:alpha/beta fold hydrolase [Deltaproteobacteria bacterium]